MAANYCSLQFVEKKTDLWKMCASVCVVASTPCFPCHQVCSELADPNEPLRRLELTPGNRVEPNKVCDLDGEEVPATVAKFGGPFVTEVKFDGWRLQVWLCSQSAGLVLSFGGSSITEDPPRDFFRSRGFGYDMYCGFFFEVTW